MGAFCVGRHYSHSLPDNRGGAARRLLFLDRACIRSIEPISCDEYLTNGVHIEIVFEVLSS